MPYLFHDVISSLSIIAMKIPYYRLIPLLLAGLAGSAGACAQSAPSDKLAAAIVAAIRTQDMAPIAGRCVTGEVLRRWAQSRVEYKRDLPQQKDSIAALAKNVCIRLSSAILSLAGATDFGDPRTIRLVRTEHKNRNYRMIKTGPDNLKVLVRLGGDTALRYFKLECILIDGTAYAVGVSNEYSFYYQDREQEETNTEGAPAPTVMTPAAPGVGTGSGELLEDSSAVMMTVAAAPTTTPDLSQPAQIGDKSGQQAAYEEAYFTALLDGQPVHFIICYQRLPGRAAEWNPQTLKAAMAADGAGCASARSWELSGNGETFLLASLSYKGYIQLRRKGSGFSGKVVKGEASQNIVLTPAGHHFRTAQCLSHVVWGL